MHSSTLRISALAITLTCLLSASCSSDLREGAALRDTTIPLDGPRPHRLCGWIYEHAIAADTELAYDTFAAHADEFDAIHPKWWKVASETTFVNHPLDRAEPFHGFHDPRVLDHTTPGGGRTRLMPLISATTHEEVAFIHRMINDPALRTAHVAALSTLALDNHYDGLDLDYEHLRRARQKELPTKTIEEERAALTAFVAALASALHAHGQELSLAIPANYGPSSEYDLDALTLAADELHVMGYDLHYEEGDHPGPVAPLGWVQHFIDHVATIDGGRRASRFILGLPNHGVYGPPGAEPVLGCEPLARCFELFSGPYETTTDEMDHCPEESGIDPGRSPNVALPDGRTLYFEDLASLEEKVAAAEAGGFGGITYWGVGGEATVPGPRTFFEMVRSHFPRSAAEAQPGSSAPSNSP
jgi:spore germination protein YaaH